ncbi:MAG: glucose-6-phosphate isomerase [bacterium]
MGGLKITSDLIKRDPVSLKHSPIKLDHRRFGTFNGGHITEHPEFNNKAKQVAKLHDLLLKGTSDLLKDGNVVMTGWKTESPFIPDSEIDAIESAAKKLASDIDDFWSVGIGGSYLGIRATIEAVKGSLELFNMLSKEERSGVPRIFFLGQNMDPAYTANVLALMKGRKVGGNVISKSGGTVEPAIAFAIIKDLMEKSYSPDEAAERIIAITDARKGSLRKLAEEKGYKTFSVPDNVGGRYSVTCPVGLFSLSAAGVNIRDFIAGTRFAEEQTRKLPFEKNIAMNRAVMRYLAHKYLNKDIEVASTGIYDLRSVTSWMQQLGPESEGKNNEGIWISPEYYTEMAHANGQMIQMGKRNMFETFIMVEDPGIDVVIPGKGTPVEYLDNKTLHFANTAFIEGLRDAHYEGGVPVMSYVLPDLSAFTLGMFFQYEMNTIALSGLLLDQNPFIQPGVQLYKDIANIKSGKPGTEKALNDIKRNESNLNPKFIL